MIAREAMRELAAFQVGESGGCALSFYLQPRTPQDRSHRGEAILAKDLVRQALNESEKLHSRNGHAKADLERVLDVATRWQSAPSRAKAIFACGSRNFWREFDLPPVLGATQAFVDRRRFRLQPLAHLLGAQPILCVALVDRQRARLFDLRLDDLRERDGLFKAMPRRRTDGYAGYDAGHVDRQIAHSTQQHLKAVGERLREEVNKGLWEKLIIGCHDLHWREFEPLIHPYVKQRLIGRFSTDVASCREDQIREQATRLLGDALDQRRQELMAQALDLARSHGRGVTGLRRVLQAMAMGEVQTLFMGEKYHARASECPHCGHLNAHVPRLCAVCGLETNEIENICDALIPAAVQQDVELFYVRDDPGFDQVGNIAALLRFRAGQAKVSREAKAG
jgi:peptide subunit release factor 1 (eRF1)